MCRCTLRCLRPRRQRNATLLRTHALRRLRLVGPLGAAHVVRDGYGVKTACFGGPTTPKTGRFGGGAGCVLLPGLAALSSLARRRERLWGIEWFRRVVLRVHACWSASAYGMVRRTHCSFAVFNRPPTTHARLRVQIGTEIVGVLKRRCELIDVLRMWLRTVRNSEFLRCFFLPLIAFKYTPSIFQFAQMYAGGDGGYMRMLT
eukprot:COSAG02_NODE_962_length_15608_cov_16.347692_15_plen_203_part_00